MNTEQAKQLSETALDRLMAALEQGQSAALKQYLAVMSRFRKYSWGTCSSSTASSRRRLVSEAITSGSNLAATSARARKASRFLHRWWDGGPEDHRGAFDGS
jgi:hypothetical protein